MQEKTSGREAPCSDGELCTRIQNGDAQAFWELAERYMSLIRAKAVRLRGGALDEEELSQEGLLGLLAAARFYRTGKNASFPTFADVCIRNRMITALRRAGRAKPAPVEHVSLSGEDGRLESLPGGVDPQERLADSEAYEAALKKIAQSLTCLEREAFFLHLRGCSYAEAARELHTTEKSVGNALQRARAKLRKLFPE